MKWILEVVPLRQPLYPENKVSGFQQHLGESRELPVVCSILSDYTVH